MNDHPLALIMKSAQEQGASDIHLGSITGLQVRIDGDIVTPDLSANPDLTNWLESIQDKKVSLLKSISSLLGICGAGDAMNRDAQEILDQIIDLDSREQPWPDKDCLMRLGSALGNWRAAIGKSDLGAISIALRALPAVIPEINTVIPLPLKNEIGGILRKMIARKNGLILVSGATGSGKTTLMAALINEINVTQKKMIVTLEDPVEYWHASKLSVLRHRQIGLDVADYASGLKAALRQDPDVILIGEMRDLETIELALRAAETGHLVLATVHARDMVSTITRLIEVFPSDQQAMIRNQLGSSLNGVISQELRVEQNQKKRVMVPEIGLLPTGMSGGARSIIREGRYPELTGNLRVQGEKGGYYLNKPDALKL